MDRERISREMHAVLTEGILARWYPLVVDKDWGGYFTNLDYQWRLLPNQEKMIVTQARHVWTLSKAASFIRQSGSAYDTMSSHGVAFLRNAMWDATSGGLYQIRSREGTRSEVCGWLDEKRTYGNAFGVYALAAHYARTKEETSLDFAQEAFQWIEGHAYDAKHGGYFQFLDPGGAPFDGSSAYKTIASDSRELGLKDQNSSIHLLEAYTELYRVWQDEVLRQRLSSLLSLIRDTMVTDRGYLQLFYQPDWHPVSFRSAPLAEREANYDLDHVSFGHDYETAFLMLEASQVLGLHNDVRTLSTARRMLDHAIDAGWDRQKGGFFDAGYYAQGSDHCRIIKATKIWWAQAEALNALLLFSRIFPEETRYTVLFERQWDYVKAFLVDPLHGDWFEGGIDKQPHFRVGPKSYMWKCTYHTGRALMNCIALLSDRTADVGITGHRNSLEGLVDHWRSVKPAGT